jgi:hypothetical protein
MADGRRIGQAQRRRIGAPSNVYSDTMKPPLYGPGDTVSAKGRYGPQTVENILPNQVRPNGSLDGHAYVVSGGKGGRKTTHLSDEISPFHGTSTGKSWHKVEDEPWHTHPHKDESGKSPEGPYPSRVLGPAKQKRDQL